MEKLRSKGVMRKIWICVSVVLALLCTMIAQPTDHEALKQISSLVVTTFSLLAGFLIAAIAVTGYSADVVARQGWQVIKHYKNSFEMHLSKYAIYFSIYLIAIILLISWSYVKNPLNDTLWEISCFVCAFSLCMSFSLPYEIIQQHTDMYDAILEEAINNAIIKDSSEFSEISDQLIHHKNSSPTDI